jgi:hypothetical protein
MGSLGYCEICGGENCTRGPVICCMSCGRPKDEKLEPKKDLDELLVGVGATAESTEQKVVASLPARRRR